jgi:hypothetical protein
MVLSVDRRLSKLTIRGYDEEQEEHTNTEHIFNPGNRGIPGFEVL